jgi:hypothetical protein
MKPLTFSLTTSNHIEPQTRNVEVISAGKTFASGTFLIWNEDPANRRLGRIVLRFLDREFTKSNVSIFHALRDIRLELERENVFLQCYGSSRHVWPSGMGLSMARGEKAYRTFLTKKGDIKDIVSIFDTGPDVYPCKWEEQCQFHQKWLLSLGIDPNKKVIPWRSLLMQRPVKTLMLYLKEKFHKA